MRRVLLGVLLAVLALAAVLIGRGDGAIAGPSAPPDPAAVLTTTLGGADGTAATACLESWRPGAAGVATTTATTPAGLGWVKVALGGAEGDWDVAVFDSSGEAIAATAEPGAEESAYGYTAKGGELRVQACRVDGDAASVPVTVSHTPITGDAAAVRADPPQLARVHTPTRADKDLLVNLGLDMTEHGGHSSLGVVLHGASDRAKLRSAGLRFDILVDDLIARDLRDRRAEARSADRAPEGRALPSGRTDTYRTLAEFNAEMKALADANPSLVKLFTMPHKTLLGKDVMGLEITENVTANDGKPAFFNMGVHHAREWPSGEMAMEWAYELVNGYKANDPRTLNVMRKSRSIVVPVVNADGFEASRSAGAVAGASDGRDPSVPDLAYIVGGATTGGEYRRKTCRLPDDSDAANCLSSPGALAEPGVDPNRNYGGLWGGPGAESSPQGLTYRGKGPFSEPETRNIQSVVSRNQVMSLITNHTTAGLVLRAPGVAALGDPFDETKGYKDLGDAMAKENGYFSQKGFELYDTTGTTEDWSYNATGGFGFTFEVYCGDPNYKTGDCDAPAFHPFYDLGVIAEWEGTSDQANHVNDPGPHKGYDGKGNREAYYIAAESAIRMDRHSVIEGTAPAGATLRLTKSFKTLTSPQPPDNKPLEVDDKLETVYDVPASGAFEWHVNPSTRPMVANGFGSPDSSPPSPKFEDIDGAADPVDPRPCPGYYPVDPSLPQVGVDATCWNDHGFTYPVGPGVQNASATVRLDFGEQDDWDMEIYEDLDGDGVSEPGAPNNEPLVGNSGNGATGAEFGFEEYTLQEPAATTKYVVRVINYAAVDAYDGSVTFNLPPPFVAPGIEKWTLTCEVAGQVRQTVEIAIARGERMTPDLSACATGAAVTPTPTATASGTVSPNPTGTPVSTATPEPGPGPGPTVTVGPVVTPTPTAGPSNCTVARGLRSVSVTPQGAGARFDFERRPGVTRPVQINVYKPATATKVIDTKTVKRIRGATGTVQWNGTDAKGRALGDGYYFARFLVKTNNGFDAQRVVLRRSGGRFSVLKPFDGRATCDTLRAFKLSRPVFGGSTNFPLSATFKLGETADVAITLLRNGRVVGGVKRDGQAANTRVTVKLRAGVQRGDYAVRLTTTTASGTQTKTLFSRRI